MIAAKLLSDVLLKLTPQKPEIWIPPYRAFAVFKFSGSNALHNEVPAHTIFLLGCHVAEGCPFPIPLAVLRHTHLSARMCRCWRRTSVPVLDADRRPPARRSRHRQNSARTAAAFAAWNSPFSS